MLGKGIMCATESEGESIEKVVAAHIKKRGGTIRNKAALGALVKIIPEFGEGLYHAMTAGDAAIAAEKQQIQLDMVCRLAEKIDQSISDMLVEAKAKGAGFVEIGGEVNVRGEYATNVTGLDISSGRSASIKPGTIVNVEGSNALNITGVKI